MKSLLRLLIISSLATSASTLAGTSGTSSLTPYLTGTLEISAFTFIIWLVITVKSIFVEKRKFGTFKIVFYTLFSLIPIATCTMIALSIRAPENYVFYAFAIIVLLVSIISIFKTKTSSPGIKA